MAAANQLIHVLLGEFEELGDFGDSQEAIGFRRLARCDPRNERYLKVRGETCRTSCAVTEDSYGKSICECEITSQIVETWLVGGIVLRVYLHEARVWANDVPSDR